MSQKELLSFYQRKKKKSDEFYSGLLTGKSKFVKSSRKKLAAAETTAPRTITPEETTSTPRAITPEPTTSTTPAAVATPTTATETAATMPIVVINLEENDSRKKQKTAAGAEKLYSDSDGNVSKIFENICKYTKILKRIFFL
jgi:hypothetical protein